MRGRKFIGVGLVGFGNIGAGVVRYLAENEKLITERLGTALRLKWICDVDLKTKRDAPYKKEQMTNDFTKVIADPDVDIVIELIGGTKIAKTVVESALRAGKAAVTANKALLAEHGSELYSLAKNHDAAFLNESAVMAGVPVLRSMMQSLAGNRFRRFAGIVNGTCNYILTRMEDEGAPFDDILKSAQQLGYAEADAELDVGGIDAAHKCAVLASLAFGQDIRYGDVYREGIRAIDPLDFEIAADYGLKIKLLAQASQNDKGEVLARVHPALVPLASPLAQVSAVFNGLLIEGDPMGPYFFQGQGAGPRSTSSGIIGDVMAIASGLAKGQRPDFQLLPVPKGKKKIAPMATWHGAYYLRIRAKSVMGGLAALAAALEKCGVAIRDASEMSIEPQGGKPEVSFILMTKPALEADFQKAIKKLKKDGLVKSAPAVMRVENL